MESWGSRERLAHAGHTARDNWVLYDAWLAIADTSGYGVCFFWRTHLYLWRSRSHTHTNGARVVYRVEFPNPASHCAMVRDSYCSRWNELCRRALDWLQLHWMNNALGRVAHWGRGILISLFCGVCLDTEQFTAKPVNVKPGYKIILRMLLSYSAAYDNLRMPVTHDVWRALCPPSSSLSKESAYSSQNAIFLWVVRVVFTRNL